jgi:hypothetical protein
MGQMAWREVSALCTAVIIGKEKIAIKNIIGSMDGIHIWTVDYVIVLYQFSKG